MAIDKQSVEVISPDRIEKPAFLYSADYLRSLSAGERVTFVESLTEEELLALHFEWDFWARPTKQIENKRYPGRCYSGQQAPDGQWVTWVLEAGRGSGKTRSGAEWTRRRIEQGARRWALVGATAADVRDTMVEGESGLLAICPPWNKPKHEPSKRRVVWPNGAIASLYSADEPDRLRGPQHEGAWCDELGSWRYPEAWDMLMFGLRLGKEPQACVTTTPKAKGPSAKLLRQIKSLLTTVITKGSTHENRKNLPRTFFQSVISRYEGTRLGKQEIYAEELDDNPGALWTTELLNATRVEKVPHAVELIRVVTGLDPAGTIGDMARFSAGLALESENDGDDCGIVAAAMGSDRHIYILKDATTSGSPAMWGNAAVQTHNLVEGDRIVGESNHGGDDVEGVVRAVDPHVSYTKVHASRGKLIRAEPVAALFEQGKAHMVGEFPELEDELVNWEPGQPSPNRLDAMVIAVKALTGDTGNVEIEDDPFEGRRW